MPTPVWVKFSKLHKPFDEIIADLIPIFQEQELRLYKISRLGWNPYEESFGYAGGFEEGDEVECTSELEALKTSREWNGLVLAYKVLPLTSYFYAYLWKMEEATGFANEITSRLLYYESDQYEPGQWLEKFLCSVTSAVQTEICAYGTGYDIDYAPADPGKILSDLKDGTLLMRMHPSFHMISINLLSVEEMKSILETHDKRPRLKYFVTTTGYHVLSNLP